MTGRSKGRRRMAAGFSVVAAVSILLALPLTSLGSSSPLSTLGSNLSNLLKGAHNGVETTVQKVTGATAPRSSTAVRPSSTPAASDPSYTPPAYNTNPHGQGSVASVSLNPSSTRPYTYAPGGSMGQGEIAVIGRGRSEQQSNGSYDAHTTILALLGTELLGVNATQGQSNTGPLNAVQTALLNKLCTTTSGLVCANVLVADTSATSTGATTTFQVANASVAPNGTPVLSVGAADSSSSISTSGSCQTSSASGQVADAKLAGLELASVSKSSTSSTACAGQTPTQSDQSSVIGLGAAFVPLPAAGCANGTPNTNGGIPLLLPIICNADNQTQLQAPGGVREALTVLGLQTGNNTGLLRAATAASESHAVAPPAGPSTKKCTDADHDCGHGETCVNGKDPDGDGDCTGNKTPGGNKKCTDADHDCGAGETCVNGADPDGDGDCHAPSNCTDGDHDCGIGPNGQREVCVNGSDPDADSDCASQVTALAAKTTLPFTGENVLLVVLVGLLLTGGGLGLATRVRASNRRR